MFRTLVPMAHGRAWSMITQPAPLSQHLLPPGASRPEEAAEVAGATSLRLTFGLVPFLLLPPREMAGSIAYGKLYPE